MSFKSLWVYVLLSIVMIFVALLYCALLITALLFAMLLGKMGLPKSFGMPIFFALIGSYGIVWGFFGLLYYNTVEGRVKKWLMKVI